MKFQRLFEHWWGAVVAYKGWISAAIAHRKSDATYAVTCKEHNKHGFYAPTLCSCLCTKRKTMWVCVVHSNCFANRNSTATEKVSPRSPKVKFSRNTVASYAPATCALNSLLSKKTYSKKESHLQTHDKERSYFQKQPFLEAEYVSLFYSWNRVALKIVGITNY